MKPLQASVIGVVNKESASAKKKIVLEREYDNTFSSWGLGGFICDPN